MNNYQYQNPYYQKPSMFPTQSNSSIIWVQGIEGAKAYQVMPGSITLLMDSENDGVFYIKVSDNIGMSSLRIFKYQEIEAQTKSENDLSAYVRKDELQDLIRSMKESIDEQPLSAAQSNKHKPTINQQRQKHDEHLQNNQQS